MGPSWTFEVSGVYSQSIGKSRRLGIREDKMAFALGIDPTADFNGDGVTDNTGDGIADDYDANVRIGGIFGGPQITACNGAQLANPGQAMPDLLQGCVPVNLFAPSVLGTAIGDFATAAERDYVFGVRNFDTKYEQTVLSGFVTGDIFSLPAGPVNLVLGLEYRKDKIVSTPDSIASNGLFIHSSSDQGSRGSKYIKSIFGELYIPLLADNPVFRELNRNL